MSGLCRRPSAWTGRGHSPIEMDDMRGGALVRGAAFAFAAALEGGILGCTCSFWDSGLDMRTAANRVKKRVSNARVAASRSPHQLTVSRCARTTPSLASSSRISVMTSESHFCSFCVKNVHRSNTNQPEMEMRPDDATS